MALGKSHDRFNFVMAFIFLFYLLHLQLDYLFCSFFILGWIYSTFYFSPDSDIVPKRRLGILRMFFYPYSMFFKHRGSSHHLILGTLVRALYSFMLIYLGIWILYRFEIITRHPNDVFLFFSKYNITKVEYKLITWFFIGMFLADACHIFLDKVTSMFKRR